MSSIEKDVKAYEKWLGNQCEVVEKDLDAKHRRMQESPFDFLRATYFRWARIIEKLCASEAKAPEVLCVGDIHVENYGTWRDAEARLVWGINDFDEAAVMPYALDLVRLTTSALLSPHLQLSGDDLAEAILKGYRRGLANPCAVLLDEGLGWLRAYANPTAKSNKEFWKEVDGYPVATPTREAREALKMSLPDDAETLRFATRRKGGGGLGRPRYIAIASWNSGHIVREAKALVPSAWDWAHKATLPSRLMDAANGRFRSPDPHLHLRSNFVLRRIAPDSRKIDIADLEVQGLTEDLFSAMAADLAAIHAASERAVRIPEDLDSRPAGWLRAAADIAKASVERDYADYLKVKVPKEKRK